MTAQLIEPVANPATPPRDVEECVPRRSRRAVGSPGDAETTVSLSQKITMNVAVLGPLAGTVAAAATAWMLGWMGPLYVGMLIGGWLLTGLGITVGFHRLLTHRSFETFAWLRAVFTLLGAAAVEGSPLVWCGVHRRHHERSDNDGDPHSPHQHGGGALGVLRGLWHAQVGWLFGKGWNPDGLMCYVPDLANDPAVSFVHRSYFVWVLLSLAVPTAVGAAVEMNWQGALWGFIWGGLARIFVTHHITWSINSVCHVFGRRSFRTSDHSKNNLLCGLLGHGEGWHNNHHAFPTSARHGLARWQFDLSWLVIRSLALVGLAWNVRLPSRSQMEAKRL